MSLSFITEIKKTHAYASKILSAAVIVLLLTSCAFIVATKPVNAQTSMTLTTQTFMSLSPNPDGVNQAVTVFVWSSLEPAQITGQAYYGWNLTVTITTPSGVATTYNLPETLSTGYTYMSFTPTTVGTYLFQATSPAVTVNLSRTVGSVNAGNVSYTMSQSTVQALNVTTQPVLSWPATPLPTGYWQTPITAENQLWGSIAGNWLYTSTALPASPAYYTHGPQTAHLLWTKPISFGGISGGTLFGDTTGGLSYYTGLLYQNKLKDIIISGYLYYDINPPTENKPGVNCVNLRTGELVWSNSDFPLLTCGQVFTRNGGLGSGSLAYLWTTTAAVQGGGSTVVTGGTWSMYDAFNGQLLTQFVNATGANNGNIALSPVYGPSGEILVYVYAPAQHWLALWNSTIAIIGTGPTAGQSYTPFSTAVRAWNSGLQWNVTIPTLPNNPSLRFVDYKDGVVVCEGNFFTNTSNPVFDLVGYSAINGQQLWVQNYTNIGWGEGGPVNVGLMVFNWAIGEGHFAFFQRETQQWHIIDIKTGLQSAITPPLNSITHNDWSYYDWHPQIAYGKLYTTGYSGSVCAFDLATGAPIWVFNQINSGVQTPYGDWPTYGGVTIADGTVYFGVTQHTPATPMYRGYNLYAINATTGAQIWSLPSFMASMAIGDGELVGYNGYDNQIYAIGTGRSATTVSTSPALNGGKDILITGTVTDQSPGDTSLGIPAAGTPAISDAYMTQWMKYLYQQQPIPTDAKGVPVTLTAIDPNGNFQNIGTVTSDITGSYAISWTPPVPGIYTITASFAGSESYYGSSGETHMLISSTSVAPAVTSTPTQTTAPTTTQNPTQAPISPSPSIAQQPTSNMPTTTYVAIGAAVVIIVAAAAALVLRRRK